MNKQIGVLNIISVVLLTACGSAPVVQPTVTLVPPTATLTPSPTFAPTSTFTPTTTPTPRLPVLSGTQMPMSGSVISADNIDHVVELARWGKGVITDAQYSPDGKLIAIATTLGVWLYQADTLDEVLYLETKVRVNRLSFSSDGKTIAAGLSDDTLSVWQVADGSLIKTLEGQDKETNSTNADEEITSVSISPDGKLLAGGSTGGTVNLWQISDGNLVNTFKNNKKEIVSVFFSPDDQSLFSASEDGNVSMINVADGKLTQTFAGRSLTDASISPNGKTLATFDERSYSTENKLMLWDTQTGEVLQKIAVGEDDSRIIITRIAFSPDSQLIAGAWKDHTAKIWSVASGVIQNSLEDLRPKDGWYYLANFIPAFSPDGQFLLVAGTNVIGIWDVKKGTLIKSAEIESDNVYDLALSPDEKTLASVEGPNIKIRNFADGAVQSPQDVLQSNGNAAFSPDATTLLTSMFDNTARLWPISDNGIKKSFESEKKDYIVSVEFLPDGQTIALETYSGTIELRQVSDGALIRKIEIGTYGYGKLIGSPDGNYLANALYADVRLFQVADGRSLRKLKGGVSAAFSKDGKLLVGGAEDKTIRIWSVPEGESVLTIKDRPGIVSAVAFSPDGKLLVSGYEDGTLEAFLAADGTLIKSWKEHSGEISDLVFSSNGKFLVSSSWDGTIRVWGLKP